MVRGEESEFVAWRISVSFVDTTKGGGLGGMFRIQRAGRQGYLRPGVVDANDTSGEDAVGVLVLNVGDVPPELLDARERREHEAQKNKWGIHGCAVQGEKLARGGQVRHLDIRRDLSSKVKKFDGALSDSGLIRLDYSHRS